MGTIVTRCRSTLSTGCHNCPAPARSRCSTAILPFPLAGCCVMISFFAAAALIVNEALVVPVNPLELADKV